jgi:hypothetical protein
MRIFDYKKNKSRKTYPTILIQKKKKAFASFPDFAKVYFYYYF